MLFYGRIILAAAGLLIVVLSGQASAVPIGTFIQGVHEKIIVNFRFSPVTSSPTALHMGLGGIGSGAGSFCKMDLYDAGGLISSVTTTHNLVCQGSWSASSASVNSITIDLNVDLSGLAAGELGRVELFPLFDPGEFLSFDMPGFFFQGGGALVELSSEIVPISTVDAPQALPLMGVGLIALAAGCHRRRRTLEPGQD